MSSATTLSTRSGHASSQEMLHLVLRIGLLPILMAIVIGLMPGKPEPNQYGPPPA